MPRRQRRRHDPLDLGVGWVGKVLHGLLAGGRIRVNEIHQERNPYFGGLNPEPIRPNVDEAIRLMAGGEYDLIFNDIDKQGYPGSLPAIEEKLRPGGVLIIDNMLWSGRILDPADQFGVGQVNRRA